MNIQKTFMPYFINLYEGILGKVTRKSIFQIIKFVSPLEKSWLKELLSPAYWGTEAVQRLCLTAGAKATINEANLNVSF